jgi:hypothetical protein
LAGAAGSEPKLLAVRLFEIYLQNVSRTVSAGHAEERMSSVSDLRVGDAERDAVADRLRESFAQGRLTMDEFNDRLSAALAATTQRDLSQLTRDLPHTSVPGPPLPQPQSATYGQRTSLPYTGQQNHGGQQSGSRGGPRARSRLFPVMAALLALWLLASTLLTPLRMFPLGGRLAIFLVIFGVLRSIVRRVFGRR